MSKTQKTIRLDDVGKVLMCKRIMKHQTSESAEIPFFKISTFGEKPDTFISQKIYEEYRKKYSHPKKGDILISAAGTVGKTVIYDGKPAYFQDSNIVWIDNDESKVLNTYLYYFYQTKPWLTTNGSTIKRIYNNNLRDIKISYPEKLDDQQKIASVLSTLDAKIELNNKINDELEQMAKTLYDYWFVQFDFPGENGKPYKSSGGKMIWNEELKRDIPYGWKLDLIENKLETYLGGTPSRKNKDYWNNGTVSWLNSGEVASFPILFSLEKITEIGLLNSAAKLLKPGSIMISITGNIRASILSIEASANQSVVGIEEDEELKKSYLYFFILNHITQYEALMTGAVQKHINKDVIDSTLLLIPPKGILEKFYKLAEPLVENILIKSKENQKLAELRDWLLPMLMNGQVTVN